MKQRQISFEAIGTRWELSVQDNVAEDAWHGLLKLIHQRITTFDKTYSRFRSDSLVTRMANEAV
jgi:thiamine biosynthesis lipoprotein